MVKAMALVQLLALCCKEGWRLGIEVWKLHFDDWDGDGNGIGATIGATIKALQHEKMGGLWTGIRLPTIMFTFNIEYDWRHGFCSSSTKMGGLWTGRREREPHSGSGAGGATRRLTAIHCNAVLFFWMRLCCTLLAFCLSPENFIHHLIHSLTLLSVHKTGGHCRKIRLWRQTQVLPLHRLHWYKSV